MSSRLKYEPGKCPSCGHDQHVGHDCDDVYDAPDGTRVICACRAAAAVKETAGKQSGWMMLPWETLGHVAEIFEYGIAKGYLKDSWRLVPPEKYFDAICRHLREIAKGIVIDPESGKPHADHLAWDSIVFAELTREKPNEVTANIARLGNMVP